MELGFETVGNATVICYDREPILVTDPWLEGPAYFGSWALSHRIPDEQMAAIEAARYVWISHGHPDHLSLDSLLALRDKPVLVSDHVGNRIHDFLSDAGFMATILKDRQWLSLSQRVRVQSLAHYNQDSILLIDIDGTLIINMNDAPLTVWRNYIKATARHYRKVVYLRLKASDADMMNYFDESGQRIQIQDAKRSPVGRTVAREMKQVGANIAIPFSQMHQYQRADSLWANELLQDLNEYSVGFDPKVGEVLPAFVSYDLARDQIAELNPEPVPRESLDPRQFGDDWAEPLSSQDVVAVRGYFENRPVLGEHLDFLRLVVGGEEHVIRWSSRERSGVTFEVPRGSLMTSVTHSVFDDLLIGNFMKTTLHGRLLSLYPAVNPYVGKFADNGQARSKGEVRAYLREYRRRAPLSYLLGRLDDRASQAFKAHVSRDSAAYDFLRRLRNAAPF